MRHEATHLFRSPADFIIMIKVYPKFGVRFTLTVLIVLCYSAVIFNFHHVATSPSVTIWWLISLAFAFALSIILTVRFLLELKSYKFIKAEIEEERLFGLQKTTFSTPEMKFWMKSDIEYKGKRIQELIIAFPQRIIRINPKKHTEFDQVHRFLLKHFKTKQK
ncbi:hypothetical protein PEPS_09240 [Persicobacter psychrovividus]|uniref:YcxB-like protein domain-containing protein n=2 Tax=Persicobacter psychrovividus TaxID=387638 RepID=A0ABM7VCI0_9BACT|nr:hypothetical protein PEPS_09240 [Persicobacter psychrovividus]